MTTTTWTVAPQQTTDAEFRLWGKAISDALTAIGMTKASDSGQIDWSTVAKPAASNTAQGYEVWSMVDAAQSTCPILVKVEYGSGAAAATPGIWITTATSSNGSGTLTGTTIMARIQGTLGSSSASVQTGYACHQAGIFWLDYGGVGSTIPSIGFGFSRFCNSSGTISTDGGAMWLKSSTGSHANLATYYRPTATVRGISGFFPVPFYTSQTSSAYGSDVAVFDAVAWSDRPNLLFGILGVYKADYGAGTTFTVTAWGSSRTMNPITGTRGPTYCDAMAQIPSMSMAMVYS